MLPKSFKRLSLEAVAVNHLLLPADYWHQTQTAQTESVILIFYVRNTRGCNIILVLLLAVRASAIHQSICPPKLRWDSQYPTFILRKTEAGNYGGTNIIANVSNDFSLIAFEDREQIQPVLRVKT